MARRRKKRGGGRKGIRVGATVGIVVGLYGLWKHVSAQSSATGKMAAATEAMIGYNPISGTFNWKTMKFTIPAAGGIGLSMVASKVGLNRYTPKGINL